MHAEIIHHYSLQRGPEAVYTTPPPFSVICNPASEEKAGLVVCMQREMFLIKKQWDITFLNLETKVVHPRRAPLCHIWYKQFGSRSVFSRLFYAS